MPARHLLIPNSSLRPVRIALGTVHWGTHIALDRARRLFERYRASGGNVIDTAHIYASWLPNGHGASERTVGEVLRAAGDRRHVIVVSKGGHSAEPFYPRPDHYLSPEAVRQDITESLERTGLEFFDLYFLHRDDARVPVSEIIDAMNAEVGAGRIRYFGASNWRVERIEEANAYAAGRPGQLMGFVASQPQFSLALPNAKMTADPSLRHLTPADLAWHARTGMPAFCYSPTAQGYFATAGQKHAQDYDNPTSRARLARLQQFAAELGVPPNTIALAYVLNQPFPAIPILGTGSLDHLAEALESLKIHLGPEKIDWLQSATPLPA